ncbi:MULTISPECIES: hypothetical protein [Gammaproteobacteria]|uniref:hypothetical protein n=1 Tax=Gammaproteobacteria TaxID=1236 RepID=UPI000DCFAB5B|nr:MULTISPECIES: hypothetical protein [Gammaproteobacteria]RTE85798.1 hypothetical protein DQX04_10125 [Aliidiomarina sp. B3213]TCZ90200.1 hypothetical protein EYQ95_10330 [Lysobacter sp. N42]
MLNIRAFAIAAVIALWAVPSYAQTVNSVISEGRALLESEQTQAAFDVFREQESKFAGNPQFDYWFGVTAFRAGEPFEASVALERVIANQPRHAGARLELVAVYIQLNQLTPAERQLDYLGGLNAPPQARIAMRRFREVIAERREQANQDPQMIMLSLDTGYDSNFLNYPDSFDLFAGTILQGIAVLEADDTMYNTIRGVYYKRWNQEDGSYLETSATGQSRKNHNSEASIFDTTIVQAAATVGMPIDMTSELRFGAEVAQLWLDNDRYRTHSGVSVGVRKALSQRSIFNVDLGYSEYNHAEQRNNFTSWDIDASYIYTVSERLRLRPQFQAIWETMSREPTRQGGAANNYSLSLTADWALNASHQISSSIGYERKEFDQLGFSVFNRGQAAIREDDSYRLRLEWRWDINQHWRTTFFAQVREQDSTVNFFDLDQNLVQGSISYVF